MVVGSMSSARRRPERTALQELSFVTGGVAVLFCVVATVCLTLLSSAWSSSCFSLFASTYFSCISCSFWDRVLVHFPLLTFLSLSPFLSRLFTRVQSLPRMIHIDIVGDEQSYGVYRVSDRRHTSTSALLFQGIQCILNIMSTLSQITDSIMNIWKIYGSLFRNFGKLWLMVHRNSCGHCNECSFHVWCM